MLQKRDMNLQLEYLEMNKEQIVEDLRKAFSHGLQLLTAGAQHVECGEARAKYFIKAIEKELDREEASTVSPGSNELQLRHFETRKEVRMEILEKHLREHLDPLVRFRKEAAKGGATVEDAYLALQGQFWHRTAISAHRRWEAKGRGRSKEEYFASIYPQDSEQKDPKTSWFDTYVNKQVEATFQLTRVNSCSVCDKRGFNCECECDECNAYPCECEYDDPDAPDPDADP